MFAACCSDARVAASHCGAREEREVRQVGAQVEAGGRDGDVELDGARPRPAHARPRRPGRRAAPHDQIALRRELRVGADDDAAGDAEVGRERAGRRQLPPDRQAAGAHERAQLPLDLEAERLPPVEVEREKWSCRHCRKWPFREDHAHPTLRAHVKALHPSMLAAAVAALVACLGAGAAAGGSSATARAFRSSRSRRASPSPIDVTSAPGDPTTLYVVEQAGRVKIVRDGVVTRDAPRHPRPGLDRGPGARPALDRVPSCVRAEPSLLRRLHRPERRHAGDRGQLGEAHATRTTALVAQPHPNHNGGQLAVRPRAASSTSAWATAARSRASSATTREPRAEHPSLLGKMLRIDPTRAGSTWKMVALGLRNPGASRSTARPATSGSATSVPAPGGGRLPPEGADRRSSRTTAGAATRERRVYGPRSR